MRAKTLAPFLAVFALAACGEDQTAQAPNTPDTESTASTSTAAPSSNATTSGTAGSAASAPATGSSTAATSGATSGSTASAPGSSSTNTQVAAAPTTPEVTAAGGAGNAGALQKYVGRDYTAGPVVVRLNPDNTFRMSTTGGGEQVQGRYAFNNGVVTFSNPTGDTGDAQFPLRCRLEETGDGFRFTEVENSCARFKDLTFKPAA